ncbi:mucin-5AC isoform X1 [Haplochromis burtoni]|uniref:Muscular LMNA interacting protein n=1 Tax=Haplochromis burtoni TaxID=8153 RepID=A0A3Q2V3D6_HAPBU|nr:mucin-5AC isoform X1 [Haplochromis burtoni]
MDSLNLSTGEVSVGVPSKLSTFTFVPAVQKLPIKNIFTEKGRSGTLTEKPDKNGAVSHEKTSRKSVSDGEIIRAEWVLINDSVEGGAGNVTLPQSKTSPARASLSQTKSSLSISAQSQNTPNHAAAETASMETGADKHRDISQQQCHHTSRHVEVSLGCCANRTPGSEDILSPADSGDLLPTLASSRESILSDASDREKSWSAVQLSSVTSPASLSRTISPCSSVPSGAFTPSVIQVKRHFLAPGSSLIHIPQTCFSSCESLSSSVFSQNPPPRHRPPLTRLSLLTAILRKGRLPVLSSALQRPYTPCWPVNPVTLSFCNACSAASSVASIPLEFSSRFSSLASIDVQNHHCREPTCQSNELNRTCTPSQVQRRSEPVNFTLPRAPVFCSNFLSASPPKHEETVCTTSKTLPLTHISISKLPELKPGSNHTFFKGSADNNLKKLISPSPKLINEPQTSTPQKWSRKPNSSLSKLRWLSQQLRSSPVFPPHPEPSHSCATIFPARADTASPLPPPRNPTGRYELERSHFDPTGATHSQGIRKAPCLSPSCYTPIVFSGWPSPTSSPTPTPSPAPPIRDLTPSPFSLRSTPSPRPGSGISDYSDREGKKRKTHKITLSYKSLAAIPTNTLLLDQQAIDEQVEREMSSCDTLNTGIASDTHTEMCSPAQLRQQSEELYAVIDEILANSIAASTRSSTTNNGLQPKNSSFSKSLGRETKYASLCSLHPSADVERKLLGRKQTKPVIRPMTAIPRLTIEDKDEFHPKPFRQFASKQTSTDKKRVENKHPDEVGKDSHAGTKGKMLREERKAERRSPFSLCDLHIKEPDEQLSRHGKGASASFSSTERHMEGFEAHI